MPKEIRKLAYCDNCSKNVPHWRRKAKGFQEAIWSQLQKLRLGRWHCLHCQRTRYLLSFVDEDAADYRIVRSSDPVDTGKPAIWSRSSSGTDEADEVSCQTDPIVDDHDQPPVVAAAHEPFSPSSRFRKLHEDSDDQRDRQKEDEFIQEPDRTFADDEEIDGRVLPVVEGRANEVKSIVAEISSVTIESGRLVSIEDQQKAIAEIPELIEVLEAEPVGNYLRDQSLATKMTVLKRFSEKYRDAVVQRILSGKAKISSLTADGKYTEAELVSWIADKAKRQDDENETIEINAFPRKSK